MLERIRAVIHNEARASEERDRNAQRERRELEEHVRRTVLEFQRWTAEYGLTRIEAAAYLDLSPHTLRQWEYD
jgi:DNA-binding transcriptional regulator YiaG